MDSDLMELNKRIAKRVGLRDDVIGVFAGLLSICVGRLRLSAEELTRILNSAAGVANPLDVIYINRDYLNHARIVAQGVVGAGNFAGLLVIGVNLRQAAVLARLSNEQINKISKYASGEVFESIRPIQNLCRFQSSARPQYAAALIAA